MDEPPSPGSASRPSFASFWKRTKTAASAATKQVTFVPVVPRIAKEGQKRASAKSKAGASKQAPGGGADADGDADADADADGDADADTDTGGGTGDSGLDGSHPSGKAGQGNRSGRASSPGSTRQLTPKEKAQIRRAQVRRAQIQHRQRKAEYMRQLELDIDTLRDLIAAAELDVQAFHSDNAAIRAQLGLAGSPAGAPMATAPMATAPAATAPTAGMPVFSLTPAPPAAPATPKTYPYTVDTVAASFSPLSLSSTPAATSHGSSAYLTATSPAPTTTASASSVSGLDSADTFSSPMSLFTNIDLDDITVSVVMDEILGNPVYQISSLNPSEAAVSSSLLPPPDFLGTMAAPPASAFEPGFVPVFETELGSSPLPPALPPAPGSYPHAMAADPPSAGAFALPTLTISETHRVVNFILALEHVCWGHVGHQFHDPNDDVCILDGHAMMATSLLLREAPEAVFTTVGASTKGMQSCITNTEPGNREATEAHLRMHQGSAGVSWQAPDISLQTLYNLAVSLNPLSDMELTPVQAWFELVARYPLDVMLSPAVMNTLKRELVGVVRCVYFGAVMVREAFESVVQRVIEPVVAADAAAAAYASGAMEL